MAFGAIVIGGCAPATSRWTEVHAPKANQVSYVRLTHEVAFAPGSAQLSESEASRLAAFLQRQAVGYGDEVAIVGLVYNDDPADAQGFLDRYGDAGYPHLLDPDGRLAIEYGVTGPPETFFVDADGILRSKVFGPVTDAAMAERLTTIMPRASR